MIIKQVCKDEFCKKKFEYEIQDGRCGRRRFCTACAKRRAKSLSGHSREARDAIGQNNNPVFNDGCMHWDERSFLI